MNNNSLARLAPVANLGDLAFEKIQQAIIRGELAPGATISDRELAEQLGVSRTPVRDAIHRLESGGLVEARGRGGWRVCLADERSIQELYQLRRILEPAGIDALDELVTSGNEDQADAFMQRIRAAFDGFDDTVSPARSHEYFDADHQFHEAIVAATGNRRIIDFYAIASQHIHRQRYSLSTATPSRVDRTLIEHQEIIAALSDRDFARARRALLVHLTTGEELMRERLRENAQ